MDDQEVAAPDGLTRGDAGAGSRRSPADRLGAAVGSSALIVAVLAIVLARPDDFGLFRGAQGGGDWAEHIARVRTLQTWGDLPLSNLELWIRQTDGGYPPLLHYAMGAVGSVVGHGEAAIGRAMVLWLLLLAASVGVCARQVTGSGDDGWRAAALTASTPALAAISLTYFFDLPMTALLWLAAAVLLGLRSRSPELAGLLAGGVWFLAAITKWTALPFGFVLLGGALLVHRPGERWSRRELLRRARAGTLVGLSLGLLVKAWFGLTTTSWRAMSFTLGEKGAGQAPTAADGPLGRFGVDTQPLSWDRLLVYPVELATSVLSPLLALLAAALLVAWLVRDRRGLPLVAATCIGQWVLLVVLIPPIDARFLLTLAPALALAAAVGLGGLRPAWRTALLASWAAVALLVIADVHHGSPNRFNASWGVSEGPQRYLVGRGLSIESGDPATAWRRADEVRDVFWGGREALWTALAACGAEALMAEAGVLEDFADLTWWDYRNRLALVRDESSFPRVSTLDRPDTEGRAAVAVTLDAPPTGEGWRRVGSFDDGRVAVWADRPSTCRSWSGR